MNDPITPHLYRLPRNARRLVAAGLDLRQLIVLAIGGSIFASLTMTGTVLGFILGAVFLAIAAALTFVKLHGQRLHAWAPRLAGFALQRARNQHVYEALPGSGGFVDHVELPGALYGVSLSAVVPGEHTTRPVDVDGSGPIGVITDKGGRDSTSYTIVIEVAAPAVLLADVATRNGYAAAWQDLLDRVGRHDSSIAQLGIVEITVPDASRYDWFASNYAAVESGNAGLGEASWNYRAMLASASNEPVHRMFVTVTVTDGSSRQSRRSIGGTAIDVLISEGHEIVAALRRLEIVVIGWLSPEGIGRLVRGSYDPDEHLSTLPANPDLIGPMGARNGWSYYVHDASVSCTLWVAQLPSDLVECTLLAELMLLQGVNRRVAFAYQPIPAEVAQRRIRSQRAADADPRTDDSDPTRALQATDTARLARDLAAGATAHRAACYITVTASTIDELNAHVGELRRTAAAMGIALQVAYGTQDTAFSWTLPIGRGV